MGLIARSYPGPGSQIDPYCRWIAANGRNAAGANAVSDVVCVSDRPIADIAPSIHL